MFQCCWPVSSLRTGMTTTGPTDPSAREHRRADPGHHPGQAAPPHPTPSDLRATTITATEVQPQATRQDHKTTLTQETRDQDTPARHTQDKAPVGPLVATPDNPITPTIKDEGLLGIQVKDQDTPDKVKTTLDNLAPITVLQVFLTLVATKAVTIQLFLVNPKLIILYFHTFLKHRSAASLNSYLVTMLMSTHVAKYSTFAQTTGPMTSSVQTEPSSHKRTLSASGGTSSPVSLLLVCTN